MADRITPLTAEDLSLGLVCDDWHEGPEYVPAAWYDAVAEMAYCDHHADVQRVAYAAVQATLNRRARGDTL